MYRAAANGNWSRSFIDGTDSADVFGPTIYAGIGEMLADSPLGWYLGGTLMPWDILDEDGEHFNIEAGLSAHWERVSCTIGYRYKAFLHDRKFSMDAQVDQAGTAGASLSETPAELSWAQHFQGITGNVTFIF